MKTQRTEAAVAELNFDDSAARRVRGGCAKSLSICHRLRRLLLAVVVSTRTRRYRQPRSDLLAMKAGLYVRPVAASRSTPAPTRRELVQRRVPRGN